jgi:hypothetical protein
MAYHFMHEFASTIRHNPVRVALAAVLLITTAIYVCADHQNFRVSLMGDATDAAEVIDLTENPHWATEIEQVVSDTADAHATSTRVAGRERYLDAHLTHAVAVEDNIEAENRWRVEQVSAVKQPHTAGDAPVWLLGILQND